MTNCSQLVNCQHFHFHNLALYPGDGLDGLPLNGSAAMLQQPPPRARLEWRGPKVIIIHHCLHLHLHLILHSGWWPSIWRRRTPGAGCWWRWPWTPGRPLLPGLWRRPWTQVLVVKIMSSDTLHICDTEQNVINSDTMNMEWKWSLWTKHRIFSSHIWPEQHCDKIGVFQCLMPKSPNIFNLQ